MVYQALCELTFLMIKMKQSRIISNSVTEIETLAVSEKNEMGKHFKFIRFF